MPSDEQLVARSQAGDADALGALYDRYCDRAYGAARCICLDDGRAEDAVQEAFLSIWRSRATYHAYQGTLAAWLLSIVRHCAIDVARRDATHAGRRAADDPADASPTTGSAGAEAPAGLQHDPLSRLPEAQRDVVTLALNGQLTHTEIAEHLGLTPGTVKGRMRLGLHKLRDDIHRTGA